MGNVELSNEIHAELKKAATRRGLSMKAYADQLISEIGVADKDAKVILTIPTKLTKNNKAGLRDWLSLRMEAIVNSFY